MPEDKNLSDKTLEMKKGKRQKALIIMIVVAVAMIPLLVMASLIISILSFHQSVVDEQTFLSKYLDLDCSSGTVVRSYDNLSDNGFDPGYDSEARLELSFDDESVLREIQNSKDWNVLPMTPDMNGVFYGSNREDNAPIGSPNFPEKAKHGYYLYQQKERLILDGYITVGAVYDSDINHLSVIVLDDYPRYRFHERPDEFAFICDGKLFGEKDNNGATANWAWLLPTESKAKTEIAYFGNPNQKSSANSQVYLYEDPGLNMFLLSEYTWINGEKTLYCDQSYTFPTYCDPSSIEAIYITAFDDSDFYGNDTYEGFLGDSSRVITNEQDIQLFAKLMNRAEGAAMTAIESENESIQEIDPGTDLAIAYIAVKYKGIDALYYYGGIDKADGKYYLSGDFNGYGFSLWDGGYYLDPSKSKAVREFIDRYLG